MIRVRSYWPLDDDLEVLYENPSWDLPGYQRTRKRLASTRRADNRTAGPADPAA